MAEEEFVNRNEHSGNYNMAGRGGYKDSGFIPIDDLVYAPLHALAKANQKLRERLWML